MSVMRCDRCDAMIDTDYKSEDISTWDPCCCLDCFNKLDAQEAWDLAIETVMSELRHQLSQGQLDTIKGLKL